MKGFVLSRHSQDTEQGLILSYWLATDHGPVCLKQTQQEAVCFFPLSQQDDAKHIIQSMGLPSASWRFQKVALKAFDHEAVMALYMTNHRSFSECVVFYVRQILLLWNKIFSLKSVI